MKATIMLLTCACLAAAGTVIAGDVEVEHYSEDAERQLPFSDAVRVGDMLYLSGKIGNLPYDYHSESIRIARERAAAAGLKNATFEVADAVSYPGRDFDLIVCDLRMPRVDGPAFYRAMAARSPSGARRIIFVGGDVAGTEAGRFLEESGCRWLPRPSRLADLLRVASEVLG